MVRKAAAPNLKKRQTNEKENEYENRVGSCDIGCIDMDIDTQYQYIVERDQVRCGGFERGSQDSDKRDKEESEGSSRDSGRHKDIAEDSPAAGSISERCKDREQRVREEEMTEEEVDINITI